MLRYCADEDLSLNFVYQEVKKIPLLKASRMPVGYLSKTALMAVLAQPDMRTVKGTRNRMILILLYDTGVLLKNYGERARMTCSEVPQRVHPHLFRHTRAMHLYQSGMPLPYIGEFLGHASVTTTEIYASADVEMLRKAIEQADPGLADETPKWKNEESLRTLCGL